MRKVGVIMALLMYFVNFAYAEQHIGAVSNQVSSVSVIAITAILVLVIVVVLLRRQKRKFNE